MNKVKSQEGKASFVLNTLNLDSELKNELRSPMCGLHQRKEPYSFKSSKFISEHRQYFYEYFGTKPAKKGHTKLWSLLNVCKNLLICYDTSRNQ